KNLCDAAIEAGVKRMILWGTVGVYGVQDDPYVTEEAPANPGNAYEISKVEQEEMALEYSRRGDFEVAVIRPAPVYGPGNRYGFVNLIKMHNILPHIPVLAKMKTRLPSVHVKDVARAGLFLMEQPKEKVDGQVFNLVDDSNIHLPEFQRMVGALIGKETLKIGIPIYMPLMLKLGNFGAAISGMISKQMGDKRPLIEEATIYYLQFDYEYPNDKIKNLGFEFAYPDVRVGLIEMVDWIKDEDMEPIKVF
ncbi:NAD-dependent epimerase/dehydratase family protein, partial [bacterium]